jgi:hypothetical protein
LHLCCDRRIDGAAKHEGPEDVEDVVSERDVPCDRLRAQQRPALPGSAPRLVVALCAREGVHERSPRPLGSKAKVDPETEAVLRDLADRVDGAAHHPAQELVDAQRVGHRAILGPDQGVVGRVEEDEVDVAPEVELAASELAHPEHREGDLAAVRVPRDSMRRGHRSRAEDERRVDDHRREEGHLRARLLDVGDPMNLPQGDADHRAVAVPSQPASQLGAFEVGRELARHRRAVALELDRARQHVPDRGGVRADEAEEGGGVVREEGDRLRLVRVVGVAPARAKVLEGLESGGRGWAVRGRHDGWAGSPVCHRNYRANPLDGGSRAARLTDPGGWSMTPRPWRRWSATRASRWAGTGIRPRGQG